jgi:nicotinamidase-related amidase
MTLSEASSPRHPRLLDPADTALVVVDVQERFRPVLPEFPALVAACVRLVRAFRLLGLPVFVTEQYPKGLGRTVPELLEVLEGIAVPEKTAFSSLGCPQTAGELRASGARSVLACGIETHVCVNQTVHDLLVAGYGVQIAADAVASRRETDRELALRKMERSGAVLTSSEMAVFELLRDARHPRFKEVQALFK